MTTMTQNQRLGIKAEQRGRVLLAGLDGGPRGEFGSAIPADLAGLVRRAETDEGVGAVVLTGTHPERFVAHAELRWLGAGGAASPTVGPRGGWAIVHAAGTASRSRRPAARGSHHIVRPFSVLSEDHSKAVTAV